MRLEIPRFGHTYLYVVEQVAFWINWQRLGLIYMLKIRTMVDDKNACSFYWDAYSLILRQQPFGLESTIGWTAFLGKRKFGPFETQVIGGSATLREY